MRYNPVSDTQVNWEKAQGIILLLSRIVKSVLALRGMTLKDLADQIGENYSSVYDVLHGRWGKGKRKVASRILVKLSNFLDIDLENISELNNSFDAFLHKKDIKKQVRR